MSRNLSYDSMKTAVKDEHELMKLMLELPPEQFDKLMKSTQAFLESRVKDAEARTAAATAASKESNNKAWVENEKNKREHDLKKEEMAKNQSRKDREMDELAKQRAFDQEQKRLDAEIERQKVRRFLDLYHARPGPSFPP